MCNLYTALRGISINQPGTEVQAARHAGAVPPGGGSVVEPGYEVFEEVLHDSNVRVGVTKTVTVGVVGQSKFVISSSGYRFPAACCDV